MSANTAIPLQHEDDFYPTSDGKPMAETQTDQEARNGFRRTEAALESEQNARCALEEKLARVKRELETT